MQSVLLSQGRWNRLHEDRQRRSESRSSRTPKQPSGGWLQRSLAPASSTRSRPGSTLPLWGGPGQASLLRFGSVQRTKGSPATRRPTSGQRLRRRSLMPVGGDSRAPLQGLSGVEGSADNPVDRGAEGDREMEEPLEGPGPSGQ